MVERGASPGKKSMVGWIGRRASFETAALRPPQDEEFSQCRQSLILILRSARRARLEGRKTVMQPLRPNSCPASAFNLPIGKVLDLADASTANCMLDGAPHKPGKIVLEVAD